MQYPFNAVFILLAPRLRVNSGKKLSENYASPDVYVCIAIHSGREPANEIPKSNSSHFSSPNSETFERTNLRTSVLAKTLSRRDETELWESSSKRRRLKLVVSRVLPRRDFVRIENYRQRLSRCLTSMVRFSGREGNLSISRCDTICRASINDAR